MCCEAIKDWSGSFLFVFLFSCSSYSLPCFFSQLPCLCKLICMAYHGQGQSATEVADLVQGRHEKWHIYSDRAFTWSKPSFRASYWKTVPAGCMEGTASPPSMLCSSHPSHSPTFHVWRLCFWNTHFLSKMLAQTSGSGLSSPWNAFINPNPAIPWGWHLLGSSQETAGLLVSASESIERQAGTEQVFQSRVVPMTTLEQPGCVMMEGLGLKSQPCKQSPKYLLP